MYNYCMYILNLITKATDSSVTSFPYRPISVILSSLLSSVFTVSIEILILFIDYHHTRKTMCLHDV